MVLSALSKALGRMSPFHEFLSVTSFPSCGENGVDERTRFYRRHAEGGLRCDVAGWGSMVQ